MKTREELLRYFEEKHKGDKFFKPNFEEIGTELLQKQYEQDMYIKAEMSNILENGITTYRISYQDDETQQEILSYMKLKNMYTYDEYGIALNRIRVGNYCIVHIPEKFIGELKEIFKDKITDISLKTKWLGRKDIQGLKVGDKVKVTISGIFGNMPDQGTIHEIEEDMITVRKYRSRTKGYILRVGQQGEIEKIKAFAKVS